MKEGNSKHTTILKLQKFENKTRNQNYTREKRKSQSKIEATSPNKNEFKIDFKTKNGMDAKK